MPLRATLFPLPGPVVAGSAHRLTVGADQKVGRLENQIETDGLVFADRRFRRRHLKLHHHNYEPVPYGGALEGGTLGRQLDRLRLANPAPAYRGNAVGGEQGKQFGGGGLQAGIGFGEIRDGGIGERDEGKAVVRRVVALPVAPVRRRTGWSGATP